MDLEAELRSLRAALAVRDVALAERDVALAERDATIKAMHRENAELRARLEAAEIAAKRLERDVEQLKRQLVGPKSERVIDPDQLVLPIGPELEPEPIGTPHPEAEGQGDADRKNTDRKKRDKHRRRIEDMDHLPTEVFESKVLERVCPCGCGAQAVTIGEDVSWRLERTPAKLIRHKLVSEKVAFPGHQGEDKGTVVTALPPVAYALPKAICGNRLLVQIAIDKYCDHLPLYRQEQRFQREGLDLSRSTLCDWVVGFGEALVPIVAQMKREVLGGTWLRADATGLPVLDPKRTKGKAHRGHLWAWGNYETVVFTYTPNKTAETVNALFPDFAGVVLFDGATEFNLVEKRPGVKRSGCWAHARRKLYEALSYDSILALKGLGLIRQLFVAERIVMGAPIEDRLALREDLCRPVIEGIRAWVDAELPRQLPGSPTHSALQYLDNQWQRLVVFLEFAEIGCHNNDSERDLRRPVKGKANFHFAGSPRGAQAAATYYALIGTCLLQGIDPRKYLLHVAGRLHEPPSALTPHAVREAWQAAAASE